MTPPSIRMLIRRRSIFDAARVVPPAAFFSRDLGEFILPYDAIRATPDPARALLDFLQSTYAAAADLGRWDRDVLECPLGRAGRPRQV